MQTSSEPLIASKRISTTLGSRIPSFYVERHLQRSLYLCVDNRNDCLSSLRRITWFIPGLIMVIQTAFKCAPIVLTRFHIGHRGTTPICAKTARLDQCNLDTKWRDLAQED